MWKTTLNNTQKIHQGHFIIFCLCSIKHTIQIRMYSVSVILGFLGLLLFALLQDILSQFTYNTYSIHRVTIYAYINF